MRLLACIMSVVIFLLILQSCSTKQVSLNPVASNSRLSVKQIYSEPGSCLKTLKD